MGVWDYANVIGGVQLDEELRLDVELLMTGERRYLRLRVKQRRPARFGYDWLPVGAGVVVPLRLVGDLAALFEQAEVVSAHREVQARIEQHDGS